MAFEISGFLGTEQSSEKNDRCIKFTVDDPLTNCLRGINFPGLKPGVWLNNQTVNLFDEFRDHDTERLKSVFVNGGGINATVFVDIVETSGWVDAVKIYDGLPLDGDSPRVMDIHNHPDGYPPAFSFTDVEKFINDFDFRIRAVVSSEGTLLMSKRNYIAPDNNANLVAFLKFGEEYPDDPKTRDKKYNIDLLWLPKESKILKKYK